MHIRKKSGAAFTLSTLRKLYTPPSIVLSVCSGGGGPRDLPQCAGAHRRQPGHAPLQPQHHGEGKKNPPIMSSSDFKR